MRCRFCGSKAIYPYKNHEQAGAGRVIAGAIIAGTVGAIAGLAGKNVNGYRCSACGMFSEQPMDYGEETLLNCEINNARNGNTRIYERYKEKYANLEFVPVRQEVKQEVYQLPVAHCKNTSAQLPAAEPVAESVKHSYSPNQFVVGSPIFISNITIKDDRGTDVLSLDINNISGKTLRSVYLHVTVYDDVGDRISTNTFALQGLSAAASEALPQAKPFNLNTNVAYKVDVICEKAAFTDDTVWRKEENPTIYSVPERTELVPESFAQYKYLQMLLTKKGALRAGQKLYYPVVEETHRLCICGNPVVNGSKCTVCGLTELDLQEVMDYDVLIQCRNDMIVSTAKERAEALQTLRQSSIKSLYQEACILMKNDSISDCEKAMEYFELLTEHKDTAEQIQQCKAKIDNLCKQATYDKGRSLMQQHPMTKETLEAAIFEFQQISGWKDTDEQIAACQQKIAEYEEDNLQRGRDLLAVRKKQKGIDIVGIVIAIIIFLFILSLVTK